MFRVEGHAACSALGGIRPGRFRPYSDGNEASKSLYRGRERTRQGQENAVFLDLPFSLCPPRAAGRASRAARHLRRPSPGVGRRV